MTSSWTGAANSNWSNAGNWSGGVPNSIDATANFGAAPSTFNVTVDSPIYSLQVEVDPAESGNNSVHLYTYSLDTRQPLKVVEGVRQGVAPSTPW